METLLQDVRYAVRCLVRAPGFAALAILCLALGIGVNSTVFSFADATTLRPLPFKDPDRLVALYATEPSNALDGSGTSYANFLDWKEQARSFSEIAAHQRRSLSITEGVESERFQGSAITWNLFPLLGVDPIVGRHFREDEDRAGAPPVVILSYGVWQRRYFGDPSILGREIFVDGQAHAVIGVMPERFAFPQVAELWVPLVPREYASSRAERSVYPYARLADGATLESASADVGRIAGALAQAFPENAGWSARAASVRDDLMPLQLQIATTAMAGAVSLVLLIACANVANLLLARATGRQREMAVRAAIGAGRTRLIRQLLTESALLGVLSAPLGIAIAYFGLETIARSIPPNVMVPYYFDFGMNTRVMVYATVAAVATGLVFGLAPALQGVRADLFGALKDGRGGGGSRRRTRTRNVLVVAEVALSLVLLVGASLFIRSLLNIQTADSGLDPSQLMTMRISMTEGAYSTPDAVTQRADDLVRRVEALPGVTSAFISSFVPMTDIPTTAVAPEGFSVDAGDEPRAAFFASTSHALGTLGQTFVAGRDFTDAEAFTTADVVIVNQAFAERFWPGRADIIGRRIQLTEIRPGPSSRVIGVVTDFQPSLLRDKEIAEPLVVLPFSYRATRDTGLTIRVAGGAPSMITAAVRRAIGDADSSIALYNVYSGAELRNGRAWASRFITSMFTAFGGIALVLASIGIYGVLAYSVAQRTREFGVRVALGATRRSIFRLVMVQGAWLAAAGIVLGTGGAFLVTRVIRTLLYNVTVTDPVSFGGMALLLAAVTVLAGCVPAARATSVDPIVALRAD